MLVRFGLVGRILQLRMRVCVSRLVMCVRMGGTFLPWIGPAVAMAVWMGVAMHVRMPVFMGVRMTVHQVAVPVPVLMGMVVQVLVSVLVLVVVLDPGRAMSTGISGLVRGVRVVVRQAFAVRHSSSSSRGGRRRH